MLAETTAHQDPPETEEKGKGNPKPPVKTSAVEITGLYTFIPAINYQLSLVFDFTQLWSRRPAIVLLDSASLTHLCIYYPVPKSFLIASLLVCPPV